MGPLTLAGEVLAAVALVTGGVLAVLAGLGLARLPDATARLQAATKPQVPGLALICVGVAPQIAGGEMFALVLVVLFQLVTAPVVAQLVGRSAYRSGVGRDTLLVDEFRNRTSGRDGVDRTPEG
ncbi:monovalent cation/H(+) antiporter subunit G [Plantactinospora sp. KLBMP9567]|uniref:cation:proton antiporter n=1 Tax=Plantactinospora sp. KLBMP9567 TaxID=3085900 RepID=UPI0029819164|nr:monovalent cation/H(+) antiporter subunit G [Plantactinospora sp. KLBMP9567]MDW5329671.1 monovalent cation/H(+) antiporter subunit G [Plantactinospora sp. KLBMP9567]